jgi:D-sedoheptulose 7-phosphate isomerase
VNIKEFSDAYFQRFQEAMKGIEATDKKKVLPYGTAMEKVQDLLKEVQIGGNKIMIIGNGGSAGVASHLSIDFWKNGNIKAMTFNDASILTCISNDYSFEDVFQVPIRQFAVEGDIVICISSSGESENILRGSIAAREMGCHVITCSGFSPDNALRKTGDLNFFVPAYSYGFVETLHQLIIHSFLDAKMYCADKRDVFMKNREMV